NGVAADRAVGEGEPGAGDLDAAASCLVGGGPRSGGGVVRPDRAVRDRQVAGGEDATARPVYAGRRVVADGDGIEGERARARLDPGAGLDPAAAPDRHPGDLLGRAADVEDARVAVALDGRLAGAGALDREVVGAEGDLTERDRVGIRVGGHGDGVAGGRLVDRLPQRA